MSVVVITDSACDLPTDFINKNPIKLLPLNISLNGKKFDDDLNEVARLKIYKSGAIDKEQEAGSIPSTSEQVYDYYMKKIVPNYDFAIGVTVSKERSPNYENWVNAAGLIQRDYHNHRIKSGRTGSFGIRIINSGTMFSGQGILAAHTLKLIRDGVGKNRIRREVEEFKSKIRALAVPKDVAYIRNRARQKGDRSISLIASMIGKTLDISPILRGYGDVTEPVAKIRGRSTAIGMLFQYAIDRLKEGVLTPYIIVSIAGDPSELVEYSKFTELKQLAKEKRVDLMTTVMNLSGGINMGPGTISIALASENETFDF